MYIPPFIQNLIEAHRAGAVHDQPQPPQAHALGGARHDPDTFANLQSKITDAVLATIANLIAHAGDPSAHHVRYTDAEAAAVAAALVAIHEAVTNPHSATSLATPDRLALRDAAGRAKFAAPDAPGDALIKGERITVAELPALSSGRIWKGTGANPSEVDHGDFSATPLIIECRTSDPLLPANGRLWLRTDL